MDYAATTAAEGLSDKVLLVFIEGNITDLGLPSALQH